MGPIWGQQYSENDSLYLIAFEKYTLQIDSFYSKYSDNKNQYSTIYVEETDLLKPIPNRINKRKVVVLNYENIKKVYKQNNWKLIQLKISPMEIENGQMEITFTPYHCEMEKNGNLKLALSDWTKVYFEFSCKNRKWIYNRTENSGI